MPSRKKKPGSRSTVRAVCPASSAGEDWSPADPLHAARGAALDLAGVLAAGGNHRSRRCLVVFPSASSSGGSSLSLSSAFGAQYFVTPTVGPERVIPSFGKTGKKQKKSKKRASA